MLRRELCEDFVQQWTIKPDGWACWSYSHWNLVYLSSMACNLRNPCIQSILILPSNCRITRWKEGLTRMRIWYGTLGMYLWNRYLYTCVFASVRNERSTFVWSHLGPKYFQEQCFFGLRYVCFLFKINATKIVQTAARLQILVRLIYIWYNVYVFSWLLNVSVCHSDYIMEVIDKQN